MYHIVTHFQFRVNPLSSNQWEDYLGKLHTLTELGIILAFLFLPQKTVKMKKIR